MAVLATMRIGAASADWAQSTNPPTLGGSGTARVGLTSRFTKHDVTVGTLIAHKQREELGVRTWDGEHHWDFDVIVMQRWMFPDLPARIRKARANGQVVVNDVDDWYWGISPSNQAFKHSHRSAQGGRNVQTPDVYRGVVAASSLVVASTPYLAERIGRFAKLVEVWRNAIDTKPYTMRLQQERPTIGWVGATPFRSGDLETLRGILGPFVERYDLETFHGGHYPASTEHASFWQSTKTRPERCTAVALVPAHLYPKLFRFDVGLVPLSDLPFNRSKSWIKGLEYAAAGVPFVAQALPEYETLRECGVGRTARRATDWLRHLSELLDPDTRRYEASRQRSALARFDIRDRIHEWDALIEGAAA